MHLRVVAVAGLGRPLWGLVIRNMLSVTESGGIEPYRAGTFEKSAPRPSAIVGCAIIASRKPV
jgi:hypothetical protein